MLGILRFCIDGKDAFGNLKKDGMYLTLVNRSEQKHQAVIDLFAGEELMPAKAVNALKELEFVRASCILTGEDYSVAEGLVQAELPPKSIKILEIEWI